MSAPDRFHDAVFRSRHIDRRVGAVPPIDQSIDVTRDRAIAVLDEAQEVVGVLAKPHIFVEAADRIENSPSEQRRAEAEVWRDAALYIGKLRQRDCVLLHTQTQAADGAVDRVVRDQFLQQPCMTLWRPQIVVIKECDEVSGRCRQGRYFARTKRRVPSPRAPVSVDPRCRKEPIGSRQWKHRQRPRSRLRERVVARPRSMASSMNRMPLRTGMITLVRIITTLRDERALASDGSKPSAA